MYLAPQKIEILTIGISAASDQNLPPEHGAGMNGNNTAAGNPSSLVNTNASLLGEYSSKLNIIRFAAICSVVWGHCVLGLEHRVFTNYGDQVLQAILLQIGKMGTVAFFIISGFLLADKINGFNVLSYLRYRLFSIIIPWVSVLLVLVLLQMFQTLTLKELLTIDRKTVALTLSLLKNAVCYSTFWFVPVSILSSCILITFKKYLHSLWFIIFLACAALFYCANLYRNWIPASHTMAILGYIFYMWLGLNFKAYLHTIKSMLNRVSWVGLASLLLVLFTIACLEGIKLRTLGCVDPFASNRLSNAVLSVILFLAFFKSDSFQWINTLKPQSNIYGVYLLHSLIILKLMPFAVGILNTYRLSSFLPGLVVLQLAFFVTIFTLAYLLVMLIRRSPFCFVVGGHRR